jgi:hypothetical protein
MTLVIIILSLKYSKRQTNLNEREENYFGLRTLNQFVTCSNLNIFLFSLEKMNWLLLTETFIWVIIFDLSFRFMFGLSKLMRPEPEVQPLEIKIHFSTDDFKPFLSSLRALLSSVS